MIISKKRLKARYLALRHNSVVVNIDPITGSTTVTSKYTDDTHVFPYESGIGEILCTISNMLPRRVNSLPTSQEKFEQQELF